MAISQLKVHDLTPMVPNDSHHIATITPTTRKSLHQNIFGKLRPLPFQYHWTVWYDKNIAASPDSTVRNKLYILHEDVADIATFYRVYNNYPWDKVRVRDSVHIFRQGVKPSIEAPENRTGGCWRFRVPKARAQAFFHEIAILCMANEFQAVLERGTLSPPPLLPVIVFYGVVSWLCLCVANLLSTEHDHVLGITSSVRFNSHIISVWNKQGDNERSIRALEMTIIDRLSPELRPSGSQADSYSYHRHEDAE